jgi:large subunit ribosomal protein L18
LSANSCQFLLTAIVLKAEDWQLTTELSRTGPQGGSADRKEIPMITQNKRNAIRQRIHARIRRKLAGTDVRPRLNVYRSLNHIYAQVIDDQNGVTLASASTLALKVKTGGNVAAAKEIGKAIAERAVEKGIKKVVFDRGGFLYHGRIKALADAAREAGLEF